MRTSDRLEKSALALLASAVLCACGGGGGGAAKTAVSANGRVALAALGGATLDVFRVGDYGSPLASTTTSAGASLLETGRFSFTLPPVPSDAVFLLVARGGQAFDANEDGVLDAAPTPNQGAVHAIVSAAELEAGEVHLSSATELVYQRVRYFLSARYDEGYVLRAASAWASSLLASSLDGDAVVDNDDAVVFDPLVHAGALFRPYAQIGPFVTALLAGARPTETALQLLQERLGDVAFPSPARSVDIVGNLAFVTIFQDGLAIVDVADPTTPVVVGGFDTPDAATDVQVVGPLAFVSDTSSLQIVDVSAPASPARRGSLPLPGVLADVEVAGTVAFVCTSGAALVHVVDVSDPAAPVALPDLVPAGPPLEVKVAGTHAYVLEPSQIETFDVTDPAAPVSLGTRPTREALRIDLVGGRLYAAGRALEVFDLSVPASPELAGTAFFSSGSQTIDLVVRGTEAFASTSPDGVYVIDVASPTAPTLAAVLPVGRNAAGLARRGGLLAVTDPGLPGGLGLFGVGSPAPSGAVGSVPVPGVPFAVAAAAGRVYVSTGFAPSRLEVFDASDPLAPSHVGSADLVASASRDLVVDGTHAFLAGSGGLEICDVSIPTAPVSVSRIASQPVRGLAVGGDVAYEAFDSALGVVSVLDPSTPVPFPTVPVGGLSDGVAFDGSEVVRCSTGVLTIFNAAIPTLPAFEGDLVLPSGGVTTRVVLRPPFAYLIGQESGSAVVYVMDYADPTAPSLARTVPLAGLPAHVALAGDFVYATGGFSGVETVDVADPATATFAGTIPVPGDTEDLAVDGGFVYVLSALPAPEVLVLRAGVVSVP